MGNFQISAAVVALLTLAACDVSSLSAKAYLGRTLVTFMGADQVTQRTYACQPGDTVAQTQARAARAHRYVDDGFRSANRRFGREGQGIINNLEGRTEVNTETSRVSRQAEAEYRCALISNKDTSRGLFAG
jgi:hypothetical protein